MNPITNAKNQNLMNQRELRLGYTGTLSSWHRQYKDSAWIFVGGLHYDLTEGDVICVFSQYGEVVNINLVRDSKTGASKGFAFLCYEDQRSTVLATDNLNGFKLAGRIIRVDHVEKYKVPTDGIIDTSHSNKRRKGDAVSQFVKEHGCGPQVMRQIEQLQEKEREEEKRREREIQRRKNERVKRERHARKSRTHKDLEPHREIKQEAQVEKLDPLMRARNPSPSPPTGVRVKEEYLSPPRSRIHQDFCEDSHSDRKR